MNMVDCQRVEREGLIELYLADRLTGTDREAFERHYFECERCFEALERARAIRAGFDTLDNGPRAASPPRTLWRPIALAAAAAVAVLIALAALLSRDEAPDPGLVALGAVTAADMPDHVPMPLRGPEASGERRRGLEAYRRGEYAAAAELLEPLADSAAPAVLHLYAGASLLASGRPAESEAHLRAARARPELADPSDWLLAKAHLQRGEADAARAALEPLAAGDGPFAARARELLARVRAEAAENGQGTGTDTVPPHG